MSEKNSILRRLPLPLDRGPIHDGCLVHIPLMAAGYDTRGRNLLALYARTILVDLGSALSVRARRSSVSNKLTGRMIYLTRRVRAIIRFHLV